MSIYGPAVQSLGALVNYIGVKRESKAIIKEARQREAENQQRIVSQAAHLRAENRVARAKQGIGGPVVEILEYQSRLDETDAIREEKMKYEAEARAVTAKLQAQKYASYIGFADPWITYSQRQGILRTRKETDDARLKALKEQNELLRRRNSALFDGIPNGRT